MTQQRIYRHLVSWSVAAGILSYTAMGTAFAQRADEGQGDTSRFTGKYWAQIRPDRAYLNGCVTGYRAFQFADSGYFIFDRKIHGSWRVDRFDNLILRTREGKRIRLVYDHQQTLMPTENGAFLRRDQRFQACEG